MLTVTFNLPEDAIPGWYKVCCGCCLPSLETLAQKTAQEIGEGIRNGMQAQPSIAVAAAPIVMARDDDVATQLKKLADMKAQGLLSEEEFQAAKQKALS